MSKYILRRFTNTGVKESGSRNYLVVGKIKKWQIDGRKEEREGRRENSLWIPSFLPGSDITNVSKNQSTPAPNQPREKESHSKMSTINISMYEVKRSQKTNMLGHFQTLASFRAFIFLLSLDLHCDEGWSLINAISAAPTAPPSKRTQIPPSLSEHLLLMM